MAQLRLDYKKGLIPNLHWSKFEFTREEVEQLLAGKNPREGIVFLRREEMEEEDSWSSYHRIYFKSLGVGDCPTEVYHFITESRFYYGDGNEEGLSLKTVFSGSMNILPIEINMNLTHYGKDVVGFSFSNKEMSDLINNVEVPAWPCISNVVTMSLPVDDMAHFDQIRVFFTLNLDLQYYFSIDMEVRGGYKTTEEKYIYRILTHTALHLVEPYIGASFNYYKNSTETLQAENEKLKVDLQHYKELYKAARGKSHAGLQEIPILLENSVKLYGFIDGEPVYFFTVNPGEKVYKCVE